MIELEENGQITQLKHCRVYMVAGFTDGNPFKGFNIWTDTGPRKQSDIEAYDTFQGWATETLDVGRLLAEADVPRKASEFRVALVQSQRPGASAYPALQTGEHSRSVADIEGFLGWLTPLMSVTLPEPVPRLLMRFRYDAPEGRIESMFITTREARAAAFGKRANFGRLFGLAQDLEVTLEPQHFLQLSDDQALLEEMTRFGDDDDTLCGLNPLTRIV